MYKGKISVIVPLYNKERRIEECIGSIIGQSYQNLEIIIVDDGSVDSSAERCQKFLKDSRVQIIRQENQGVSAARNTGVLNATGERIVFVDADDDLKEDYIEALCEYAEYDLTVCGYTHISENGIRRFCLENKEYLQKDMPQLYCDAFGRLSKYFSTPYLKLFKMKIIEKEGIRFERKIAFGEDTCFVMKYLSYCKSVKLIENDFYYNYAIGDSLSRSRVENVWEKTKYIYEYTEQIYKENDSANPFLALFYLRNVRVALVHSSFEGWRRFLKISGSIGNDLNKRHRLDYSRCSRSDQILLLCLKFKLYVALYIFLRMKYGEKNYRRKNGKSEY